MAFILDGGRKQGNSGDPESRWPLSSTVDEKQGILEIQNQDGPYPRRWTKTGESRRSRIKMAFILYGGRKQGNPGDPESRWPLSSTVNENRGIPEIQNQDGPYPRRWTKTGESRRSRNRRYRVQMDGNNRVTLRFLRKIHPLVDVPHHSTQESGLLTSWHPDLQPVQDSNTARTV
ncbi:unnamed protein product [Acanthosepion pharaonis]|uniref:Uncharacterized protein n=1 Tax=Acanthosepion pharaonis TaxID=158019 RepID=A0A812BC30_ACAPH|nr:unnamed protein product [Sepia pharaonis]